MVANGVALYDSKAKCGSFKSFIRYFYCSHSPLSFTIFPWIWYAWATCDMSEIIWLCKIFPGCGPLSVTTTSGMPWWAKIVLRAVMMLDDVVEESLRASIYLENNPLAGCRMFFWIQTGWSLLFPRTYSSSVVIIGSVVHHTDILAQFCDLIANALVSLMKLAQHLLLQTLRKHNSIMT